MASDGAVAALEELEARILDFLAEELLPPDVEVGRDDELLAGDLLDSIGVVRLASFVEEELGVVMRPADLVVENFQTVAALAGFVAGRRAEAAPPGSGA